MKRSQLKEIVRESISKYKGTSDVDISNDKLSEWLSNDLKLGPAEYINNVMEDLTEEEIDGLKYAYKKFKSGDTGFAKKYIQNTLMESGLTTDTEGTIKYIMTDNGIPESSYKIKSYGGNSFKGKKYLVWASHRELPSDLLKQLKGLVKLNMSEPDEPYYDLIEK